MWQFSAAHEAISRAASQEWRTAIETLAATIGPALLRARIGLRVTQEQLAERLEISPAYYGRVERGHALPSVPMLYKLVLTLEVSADELLGLATDGLTGPARETGPGDPDPREPGHRDSIQIRRIIQQVAMHKPQTTHVVLQLIKVLEDISGSARCDSDAGPGDGNVGCAGDEAGATG